MKKILRGLAVSAVMLFAVAEASATTVTLTGSGNHYTGGFDITHNTFGMFTDEFIILPTFSSAMVSSVLSTIGFDDSEMISFSSVKLNGQDLTIVNSAPGLLAWTTSSFMLTGPITLTVTGFAGTPDNPDAGANATYSGTFNLTVVPEPEGYALMLAGLGVIGYIGRRKRKAHMAA